VARVGLTCASATIVRLGLVTSFDVVPIATGKRVPTVQAQLIPETEEPIPGRFMLDRGPAGRR
jgi:hypothetical protein